MTDTAMTAVAQQLAQGTWSVDPSHSSVEFRVKHMGIATVKGVFADFEGALEVAEDGAIRAAGTVKAGSVDTRSEQRDEHLRSADFFDVENHPEIRFESKEVRWEDDDELTIVGDLTIRGVTKEIELEAELQGLDQDPWGNTRAGLEVKGEVNREDYGLTWNQMLESGGVLVGKKVKIALDLSLVRG